MSGEARFALLASTAGRLLAAEEPETAIARVCQDVMDHLDCQVFFNYLAAADGKLQLNACAGVADAELERVARIDPAATICGEVARRGRSVVAEDIQASTAPEADLVRGYGVQAYCCHPMTAGGALLGTLSFGTRTRTRFTAEEVALMRGVADQVATTIERGKSRALKAVNSQLVEMNRRKDELLAALAHELRNPLAAMGSALDVLRLSDDGHAAAVQARRILDRQFGKLVELVDDLLDVSRITRGTIELRKERVDLRSVVERAADALRARVEAAEQSLNLHLPGQPVEIEADTGRMIEVVTSLVGNATKFTGRGGRIDVRIDARGRDARLTVTDTGVGIPAEFVPHVFDVLTQGPDAADRRSGLGIGLTLARSLVRMHGGTIDARSEGCGRGAEFVVRLPLVGES